MGEEGKISCYRYLPRDVRLALEGTKKDGRKENRGNMKEG